MNELWLFVEVIVAFGGVVIASKAFGKSGLVAWIGVATVLANIMTAKTTMLFGMEATLGTVLFASTFLATDVLTEKYGKKEAEKAVAIGAMSAVAFIIAAQIALLYTPSANDYANESMQTLFSLNLRISAASIVMYLVANLADVYLYSKIKEKTKGKKMWLRNNVATILCNALENFGFVALAFFGVFPVSVLLTIAVTTSVIEIIAAVCDTPFLYLAVKERHGQDRQTKEGNRPKHV